MARVSCLKSAYCVLMPPFHLGAVEEDSEEEEDSGDDESDDESLVKEPGVTMEDDASLAPEGSVRTKSSKSKRSTKSGRSKYVILSVASLMFSPASQKLCSATIRSW